MQKYLGAVTVWLGLTFPVVAQSPAPWPNAAWNPKPVADDFVLPLPCGGAIAFREIAVTAGAGPLDDRRVLLGSPDPEFGYNEFQRGTFIAGGFKASDQARRFWLGKYETTRDQYAAVMGSCPTVSPDGRRPKANLSWYDAVAFTERLNVWLLGNAPDRLPRQDGALGFVRLPTEDEWEYAARGGVAISEAEFTEPAFPMPEGPEQYVMAGSARAGNRSHPIGQLLPNPLGLYDILGNVGEFILEPYRLNRVGRPHGHAGGPIVKGGDYGGQPDELRTSQRVELPPFNAQTKQATRRPQVGFRVAISVAATTSLPQTQELRSAFAREMQDRQSAVGSEGDPQAALGLLRRNVTDPGLQVAIQRIEAQLAADRRARNDQRREVVRAQLESMAAVSYTSWQMRLRVRVMKEQLTSPAVRQNLDQDGLRKAEIALADLERTSTALISTYIVTLRRISDTVTADIAREEVEIVRRDLRDRRIRYGIYLDMIDRHIQASQSAPGVAIERASRDIETESVRAGREFMRQ